MTVRTPQRYRGHACRRTHSGRVVEHWTRDSMPTIPPNILDCAIYLYPTAKHAEDGVGAGGSGFLTILPVGNQDKPTVGVLWAVTCSHVVDRDKGNSPVIRLNNRNGAFEVVELETDAWIHHDTDDLAVTAIALSAQHHQFKGIPPSLFVEKDSPQWFPTGADAFMVGRFVKRDGRQKNLPAVRFGNIAQQASEEETVELEGGLKQESFLVEVHSLSGYSGSPVFAYFPFPTPPEEKSDLVKQGLVPEYGNAHVRFLGVDCAHIKDYARVLDRHEQETEFMVKLNTGMAAVIPAWKLAELFEQEEVVAIREQFEEEYRQMDVSAAAVPDATPPSEGDEFDQFEGLTRKLVRVPKKELDEEREGES